MASSNVNSETLKNSGPDNDVITSNRVEVPNKPYPFLEFHVKLLKPQGKATGHFYNRYVIIDQGNYQGMYIFDIQTPSRDATFTLCGKMDPPLKDDESNNFLLFRSRLTKCDNEDSQRLNDMDFNVDIYQTLVNNLNKLFTDQNLDSN